MNDEQATRFLLLRELRIIRYCVLISTIVFVLSFLARILNFGL